MLEEFKKFIMRGNVVDLAVGVIIGLAFGAIVTSLVSDIIMPIIGAITGGLDFSNYYLPLSTKVEPGLAYVDAKKQGAVLAGVSSDCRLEFLDHRSGIVPRYQRNEQTEEGRASCTCPRTDTRGKTSHRNPGFVEEEVVASPTACRGPIAIRSSFRRSALCLPLRLPWWRALRRRDDSAEHKACRASSALTGR